MKIVLSLKEANNLKRVMESAKDDSVKELREALKNNNVVTCNTSITKKQVTISVDDKCMEEFLDIGCKYIDLFIGQVKLLHGTACMFQSEVESVVNKYQITTLD